MPFRIYRKIKRNITEDGLIIGSSSFLGNSMIGQIDFSRSLRILEIGSGRGAFTTQIIRRMSMDSELEVSELKSEYNPWIERVMERHPSKAVKLHNGCVTQLLADPGRYDIIVSSLPLRNFKRLGDSDAFLFRVIEGMRFSLKSGGMYLQYQYFRSNKGDIETIFGKKMDDVTFVPLNVLPAFVYSMTKAPD